MKKNLYIILIIAILPIIVGCKSNEMTTLYYRGDSLNWDINMKFNENDRYVASIKYKGEEELPIEGTFDIEYLSGKSDKGMFNYAELEKIRGGVALEDEYDIDLHGDTSKKKNKESLEVKLVWNNQEEIIQINRVQ